MYSIPDCFGMYKEDVNYLECRFCISRGSCQHEQKRLRDVMGL